jgi:phosphohistidine phosphatase
MKTLYIVRHAKSSWDEIGLPDYERPLLDAGRKRTEKIIDYLVEKQAKPDLIMSSHAVRAKDTAALIARGLSYPEEKIQQHPVIYEGNEDDLFDLLFGLPDENNSVMIVGHNPTVTSFANYFLREPMDWMPTTGVVCIEFNTDKWENIIRSKHKTKFVIAPKLIKDGKGKK